MDFQDDDRLDETALNAHDDVALEAVRFELARDGDHRLGQVVRILGVRATPAVVHTCHRLGAARGVGASGATRAIIDAQARIQLRLRRIEQLPPIERLAIGMARAAIESQPVAAPAPPKLTPRSPELRIVKGLHDGTIRRNDPGMS